VKLGESGRLNGRGKSFDPIVTRDKAPRNIGDCACRREGHLSYAEERRRDERKQCPIWVIITFHRKQSNEKTKRQPDVKFRAKKKTSNTTIPTQCGNAHVPRRVGFWGAILSPYKSTCGS